MSNPLGNLKKGELIEKLNKLENENSRIKRKLESVVKKNPVTYQSSSDAISEKLTKKELKSIKKINRKFIDGIFENSFDGIMVLDAEGTIISVNKIFCKLMQCTKGKVLNKNFTSLMNPAIFKDIALNIKLALKGDDFNNSSEFILYSAEGRKYPLGINISQLFGKQKDAKLIIHIRSLHDLHHVDLLQNFIIDVTKGVNEANTLTDFFEFLKKKLSELMPIKNFYAALYNSDTKLYSFPYHSDEYDKVDDLIKLNLEGSLTDLVRKSGKPLFVDIKKHREMIKERIIEKSIGRLSKIWIGVPLKVNRRVIGVLAAQDYQDKNTYTQDDLGLLQLVAENVSSLIWRKQSEEKLRRSEENYRQIFNGVTDTIVVHDYDSGEILDVNDTAVKMFELSREELIGIAPDKLSEGNSPYSANDAFEWIKKAKSEGKQSFHWISKTSKGRLFWTEVTLKTVQLGEGKVILAIVRDINARKMFEEEKEKYSNILNSTTDFVSAADTNGNIIFINNSGLRLLGWDKNDVKTKKIKDCHPEWAFDLVSTVGIPKSIESGTWRGETALRGPIRNEIPVSQVIMSHKNAQGEVEYFSTVIRDISERIQMERRLIENENKYRAVFESANDAIFILRSNIFVDCNPKTLEMFKCTKEQIVGSNPAIISPEFQPDGTPSAQKSKEKVEATLKGVPQFFEWQHKKFDGTVFDVEVSLSTIELDNGKYVQGLVRDITERKKSEQELRSSEVKYRSLFEAEADAIVLFELDSRKIIDVNQTALSLYGYSMDEFLQLEAQDISAEQKTTFANLAKLSAGEIQKIPLLYHIKKDETVFPVEISASLFDFKNKPTVCAAIRDISERIAYEVALKKSEKLNRELLEASPVGIIYLDIDEKVLYVNSSMKQILNLGKDAKHDFIGEHLKELPILTKSEAKELIARLEKEGNLKGQEYKFLSKDGDEIYIEIFAARLFDYKGNVSGNIITVQDIGDRKKARQELERTKSLLLAAIEQNPAGIILADARDGKIKIANAAALAIRGKTDVMLTDITLQQHAQNWNFFTPDGNELNNMNLPLTMALKHGEISENINLTIKRDNGDNRLILANAAPIKNKENEIVEGIMVFQDITESKRIEDVLFTFVEELSAITGTTFFNNVIEYLVKMAKVEFGLIGEITSNKKSVDTIAFWNENKIDSNFTYSLENAPCNTVLSKSMVFIERGVRELYTNDPIMKAKEIESYFGISLFGNNEEPIGIIALFSKRPNYDKGFIQTLLKIFGLRCASEMNRMISEQEVLDAKDKAERANQLKSEFLAQMSHEIRTPINTILSFSNLIKDDLYDKIDEDMQYGFTSIESAGKRIIRTIDLILNMSEIQTGTYEPNFKEIDIVRDVLDDIYDEFVLRAKNKGLEFVLICNLTRPIIYADRYTISQIFNNLVDNAIKYTKKGNVVIKLSRNKRKQIVATITDTGIGISKKYLPNLFQAFSQEDTGYTRKFEGNGLGLALVKKYCEVNNAEIIVESQKGHGSKFTIIL